MTAQGKRRAAGATAKRGKVSAGLLVYRRRREPEYLLAHPGGPLWAKKDDGAWTIPKGLVEGDDLVACALREFSEETGLAVHGALTPLEPVRQKSGKTVHAFAVEADLDLATFASNLFAMEWPPRSGRRRQFPEVDRIAYFPYAAAMRKIIVYQRPLVAELHRRLTA